MLMREDFFLFKSERLLNPWHFDILKSSYEYIDEFNITENTVHWHNYFEIEIIVNGSFTHKLNNKKYHYSRGDVCILNYFDFHTHIAESNEPILAYNINFDEYAISGEISNILLNQNQPLICHFEEDDFQRLLSNIETLIAETDSPDDQLKLPLLSASFNNVLISILRKCLNNEQTGNNNHFHSYIHKAISIAKSHFRENIPLVDLAKMVGLTPNYLGSLFKKKFKMTYTEYIRDLRLKHAKNLLTHSDSSIEFIALNSGFQTSSYFVQCFKKRFGITPKQYQIQTNKNFKTDSETNKTDKN